PGQSIGPVGEPVQGGQAEETEWVTQDRFAFGAPGVPVGGERSEAGGHGRSPSWGGALSERPAPAHHRRVVTGIAGPGSRRGSGRPNHHASQRNRSTTVVIRLSSALARREALRHHGV